MCVSALCVCVWGWRDIYACGQKSDLQVKDCSEVRRNNNKAACAVISHIKNICNMCVFRARRDGRLF